MVFPLLSSRTSRSRVASRLTHWYYKVTSGTFFVCSSSFILIKLVFFYGASYYNYYYIYCRYLLKLFDRSGLSRFFWSELFLARFLFTMHFIELFVSSNLLYSNCLGLTLFHGSFTNFNGSLLSTLFITNSRYSKSSWELNRLLPGSKWRFEERSGLEERSSEMVAGLAVTLSALSWLVPLVFASFAKAGALGLAEL